MSGPGAGGPTWELSGHASAAGIAGLLSASGMRLSPADRSELSGFAGALRLTLVVGRADRLPRLLALSLSLDKTQLGVAASSLSSLRITISLRLSGYGATITFAPPARYRPLSKLVPASLRKTLAVEGL